MRVTSKSNKCTTIVIFVVIDTIENRAYLKMRNKRDYKKYLIASKGTGQFWIRLIEVEQGSTKEKRFRKLTRKNVVKTMQEVNKYKMEIRRGGQVRVVKYFPTTRTMGAFLGVNKNVVTRYIGKGPILHELGIIVVTGTNTDLTQKRFSNPVKNKLLREERWRNGEII